MNSTPSGLYNAPFTKFLLLGSLAINLSFGYFIFKKSPGDRQAIASLSGVTGFLLSQFLYNSVPEMVFGFIFIYSFRLFERMLGTSKYAFFYLSSTGVAGLLQLSANVLTGRVLKLSPFSFIFSCLVLYYKDVPPTQWYRLFKVPLTDKSLTYFFAIQSMFGFPNNMISNLIGVASGVISSSSVLGLSQLNFPRKLRTISKRIFLPLLQSTPPNTSYRQHLERQQRRQGHGLYNDHNNVNNPMAAFQQQIHQNMTQMMNQPPVVHTPPTIVEPSEDNIETLVSMGFPRSRAIEVLQRTNNNLNEAASII